MKNSSECSSSINLNKSISKLFSSSSNSFLKNFFISFFLLSFLSSNKSFLNESKNALLIPYFSNAAFNGFPNSESIKFLGEYSDIVFSFSSIIDAAGLKFEEIFPLRLSIIASLIFGIISNIKLYI